MTESCSLLFGVLFITVFPIYLQAAISLPSYGNVTYVAKGSDVSLVWTYDFGSAAVGFKQWFFSNTSESSDFTTLILLSGSTKTIDPKSPFKNIDVSEPATLVLKNVNIDHNGTYKFTVSVFGFTTSPFSEILVIIQERPTAVTNCSGTITLNEGDRVTCLCDHTGGNPPPTAIWSKDGSVLVTGYLKAYLVFKNVKPENAGTYKCTVKSHNLQDDKPVKLVVQFKPNITTFKGESEMATLGKDFKITCKAEGVPVPDYTIYHNGTILAGVKDGVETIQSVKYSNAGNYTCNAGNTLGNDTRNFNLSVTAPPATKASRTMATTVSTPSTTSNTSVRTDDGGSGGLGTGAIVGIVIGSLFVVILIAFLIYWFYCKGSSKSTEQGVPVVSNADGSVAGSLSRGNDDNAYESVDQEKLRREAAARNEGDDGGDDSTLPPVYAVVDKTKKKKEKKPAQPTYASLDPVALQPDSSKMRDRSREETNYASINLDSLQSDLV